MKRLALSLAFVALWCGSGLAIAACVRAQEPGLYEWRALSPDAVEHFDALDYRCLAFDGPVCTSWQRVERDPFGEADEEL